MSKKHLVAPSILSADFSRLGEEIKALEKAGADRLHIDVMDGHFVPNLSVGPAIVRSVRKITHLPLDLHLMVHQPEKMIGSFLSAGADSLTFHIEALKDPRPVLEQIQKQKVKAGLTLKPATNVKNLFPFLSFVDIILIMTVSPGFGGQTLLPNQTDKISAVKKELLRQGLSDVLVHVDGGVNSKSLPLLSEADVLVAGHFIFNSANYQSAISALKCKKTDECKKSDVKSKTNKPLNNKKPRRRNKGAILVEYVLLLVACVAIAEIIRRPFHKDPDPTNAGTIIKTWHKAIKTIAEDE